MLGQQAKLAKQKPLRRAAAPTPNEQPATTRAQAAAAAPSDDFDDNHGGPMTDVKSVGAKKRQRQHRAAMATTESAAAGASKVEKKRLKKRLKQRQAVAKAVANVPAGTGSTAVGRIAAHTKEGRSEEGARQAAEHDVRNLAEPILKHLKQGRAAKAAAQLGGLLRLYVVEFTSVAYELEKARQTDWGKLPVGTLVLDAQHTNLLIPGKLVYGDNPAKLIVPAEQVLHVFYKMAPYQLPKTANWAHIKRAMQLSTEDYEISMAELRDR